jgi:hypothetical protein
MLIRPAKHPCCTNQTPCMLMRTSGACSTSSATNPQHRPQGYPAPLLQHARLTSHCSCSDGSWTCLPQRAAQAALQGVLQCPHLAPASLDTCLLHERPNKRGCCIHRSSGQLLDVRMLATPTAEKLHTHQRSRVCNMCWATGPPRKTAPHPSQNQQPHSAASTLQTAVIEIRRSRQALHTCTRMCARICQQPNNQGTCRNQDRDCCCYY